MSPTHRNTKAKKSRPVKVGGKIVAVIRGNVLDIRKHENHLIHTPPAIGLNVEALQMAEDMGAVEVQVTIYETGKVYHQTIESIKKFSQIQRRGGFERRHGRKCVDVFAHCATLSL